MKLRKPLLFLAVLLCAVLIGIWLSGSYLMSPAPETIGAVPPGLNGETVQFQSESGSMINGWFIPGTKGMGGIILMHGVRSNRRSMIGRGQFLSQKGYSVLLFDFQAHGESIGKHITFGSLESKDAQAAMQFIRRRTPGEKIGVIGVSMGGAATVLATPPLNADAIVLEMVYPTIEEAVNDRLAMRLGGWSTVLTPFLLFQLKPRLGVYPRDLRPIDHVGQLIAPKLFIAGADDRHTTIEESQRLYETAKEPKEFWVVPGAAHVDLYRAAPVEYEQRVLEFFKRNLK